MLNSHHAQANQLNQALPPAIASECPVWSFKHEQFYQALAPKLAQDFEAAGALQTDAYSLRKFPQEKENMPHLRALCGLFIFLAGDKDISLSRNCVDQLTDLLSDAKIESMLDAGASTRGALLWLARAGILEKLNIKSYAVDIGSFDELRLMPYRENKISYYPGVDIADISKFIPKVDIIFSTGVLSVGGFMDYQNIPGMQKIPLASPHFLSSLSEFTHSRIKTLIDSLTDNPSATLVATSYFGSLAVHKDLVTSFARINLWQDSIQAKDSTKSVDFEYINGVEAPYNFRSTAEGRAWGQRFKEHKRSDELIEFGEKLLSGTKLIALGKYV